MWREDLTSPNIFSNKYFQQVTSIQQYSSVLIFGICLAYLWQFFQIIFIRIIFEKE